MLHDRSQKRIVNSPSTPLKHNVAFKKTFFLHLLIMMIAKSRRNFSVPRNMICSHLLFFVSRLRARVMEHCLTANAVLMDNILLPQTHMDTCSSLVSAPAASMTRYR